MTIYGTHAYIILMNWSRCRVTPGYNCLMMNIIQQVTDPMSTNLPLLFLLSYYCYHHCYTCYKITAITVTVTIAAVTTIKTIKLLCY